MRLYEICDSECGLFTQVKIKWLLASRFLQKRKKRKLIYFDYSVREIIQVSKFHHKEADVMLLVVYLFFCKRFLFFVRALSHSVLCIQLMSDNYKFSVFSIC